MASAVLLNRMNDSDFAQSGYPGARLRDGCRRGDGHCEIATGSLLCSGARQLGDRTLGASGTTVLQLRKSLSPY